MRSWVAHENSQRNHIFVVINWLDFKWRQREYNDKNYIFGDFDNVAEEE